MKKINVKKLLTKESLIILVALLTVIGLTVSMIKLTQKKSSEEEENETVSFDSEARKDASLFDEGNISEYGDEDNCWIVYKSAVYDLTDILSKVPEINAEDCGKEYAKNLPASSFEIISPYIVAYTTESS